MFVSPLRIPVEDHGTIDISGNEITISVSVVVGSDSQGHFTLSTTDCSFHVSDFSVDFHGGAR